MLRLVLCRSSTTGIGWSVSCKLTGRKLVVTVVNLWNLPGSPKKELSVLDVPRGHFTLLIAGSLGGGGHRN